jgi:hypothetical protein
VCGDIKTCPPAFASLWALLELARSAWRSLHKGKWSSALSVAEPTDTPLAQSFEGPVSTSLTVEVPPICCSLLSQCSHELMVREFIFFIWSWLGIQFSGVLQLGYRGAVPLCSLYITRGEVDSRPVIVVTVDLRL